MARFDEAVQNTLRWEGGYSFDPNDPGGETRYGISKREHPSEDIKNLTVDRAKAIYSEEYWKPWMGEIVSQPVANKVFDQGVLSGIGTVVKILQIALGVAADGVFGPGTLLAVNAAGDALLEPFKAGLVAHYKGLVAKNSHLNRFLGGWLTRAAS